MKIYTKTGDKGKTSLYGGSRIGKQSLRIDALGKIDEVNSMLGMIVSEMKNIGDGAEGLIEKLIREQSNFLRLGADIATRSDVNDKFQSNVKRMEKADVEKLEEEVDVWTEDLEPLTKFIIPGGIMAASITHHTRSSCRSCERTMVSLALDEEVNEYALMYMNRLSDWLFSLARFLNHSFGEGDIYVN